MHLKLLLSYAVFADIPSVKRIVIETSKGAFGLLPQRLDCVAALVPGMLMYETDREHYIAIDEGLLVKAGPEVWVSVRSAIRGENLVELQEAVEQEFERLDEQELESRSSMKKMESGFVVSLDNFRKD